MSDKGLFSIKFSRPLVYPRTLLWDFNSQYRESVPALEPTEAELKEIQTMYDELKAEEEAMQVAMVDTDNVATETSTEECSADLLSSDKDADESYDFDDYDDFGDYDDYDDFDDDGDDGDFEDDDGGKRRSLQALWTRNPDLSKSIESRLTVTLADNSDFTDEIQAKVTDFTWSLSMADESTLTLNVTFSYPELIGSDDSEQTLMFQALFSDIEPGWNDEEYLFNVTVPK